MRLAALSIIACVSGCATAGAAGKPRQKQPAAATKPAATTKPAAPTKPAAKPKDPLRAELERAESAMARGALDEADQTLTHAAGLAGDDLKKRLSVAYDRATLAVYRGDPARAAAFLSADLPELSQHPDSDGEFWAHNELTWVRWAAGDLAGALVETGEQRRSAEATTLPQKHKDSLMRHALWDRAYLLRELAASQPEASRAPTLGYARLARDEYDRAAQAIGGEDGQAVLEAFFALSDGDGAAALRAAKRVDAAKDDDVQDLYVLERALEAGGDGAAAEAIRARIRKSQNVYLGLPMYQRQLELDRVKK